LKSKSCHACHLYWIGEFSKNESDVSDVKYGNWADHLAKLHQDGLSEWVTFLGFKDNVNDYLRLADIFVLPSREDPLPLVALQAANCGLPIICFADAGGTPDLVGEDAGYVVSFEDVEAMADKTVSLMQDRELRQALGSRAREKFVAHFTAERTLPLALAVCRKIANRKPAVSVIVPNYNHAQYLPQRLDSIFNQTFQDFEVILLDDSSTDNSMDVLEKYAGRGDVKILRNERNTGSPFQQWLKGIYLARSDILWIAESDDICTCDFLQTLLPTFKDPKVKLSYANSHIINEHGEIVGDYLDSEYLASLSPTKWRTGYTVPAAQEINDGLGVKNTILNASAVLFRKFEPDEKFRKTLSDMRIAGDWYFIAHAIKDGAIQYEAKKLNYHRRHSESIIGKTIQDKKIEDFFQEFYVVQKYIFNNYILAHEFQGKWEKYLRQQWNDFYPGRSFDDLKNYYPIDEMRELILHANQPETE
jgi:glycosyltransferase involved in cell wall biosynthesis